MKVAHPDFSCGETIAIVLEIPSVLVLLPKNKLYFNLTSKKISQQSARIQAVQNLQHLAFFPGSKR